jgi:Rad3-related DNA helicase
VAAIKGNEFKTYILAPKMIMRKEFYQCLTGNVSAKFQRGELFGKFYQIIPSLLLNNDTHRLLLKYATGSGKTLAAIMLANKYRKMGKRVIVVTYVENRFNDDIIQFYKFTPITYDEKIALERKEKLYFETRNEQHKSQYLFYRKKLINSVGIEVMGYKKL